MPFVGSLRSIAQCALAAVSIALPPNWAWAQTSNPNNPDFWTGLVIDGMQLQILPNNSAAHLHFPVFVDRNFLTGASICTEVLRGMAQQNANDKLMRGWRDPAGQPHPGLIGRRLGKGFSVHSNSSSEFSQACVARTQMVHVNGALTVDVKLANNRLNLQLTQPTFFGSYADPKFIIFYDIHAWVTISIPQSVQQPLIAARAVVEIGNFRHQGANVTGDLAEAVYAVYSFVRTNLLHQSSPIPLSLVLVNQSVQPKLDAINAKLRAVPPNFRIDREYDEAQHLLKLYATDRPPKVIERPK